MQSELARCIHEVIKKPRLSGKQIAPLLRDSSRLIPYACHYLVHADPDVRFVAADALLRVSRFSRNIISAQLENILRGLKFQDAKTRTKILSAIAPIVHEYPVRVERYLATISYCLYNQETSSLRTAAAQCLGNLASLDERRMALYIPMLLQCINKYRTHEDTWKIIRVLYHPLRKGNARRYYKRIREVITPFRRRGAPLQRNAVKRIIQLTTI